MKKSQVISVRVTDAEYESISRKATDAKLSVSAYLREKGLSSDMHSQALKEQIYSSICVIKDHLMLRNYESINKECDRLWLSLK